MSSRQLAAIMFTDIVGYTALMQENEENAVALIKHYNAALNETVGLHEGKVLNYYGDGSLCTFFSATEAIKCAMDIQIKLQSEPLVPLRIGLHIGEVFFEEGKALGDGVNVASRIQSLGQANTILFSKEIFDKIKNHPELIAISLGKFDFKNVEEPLEVFALTNEGLMVPKREQMSGKLKHDLSKKKRVIRGIVTVTAALFILLIAGFFLYTKYFSKQDSTVEKSIAIIPFTTMSNDPQQESFAVGMMDEISNQLYKIGGLNVISRTSSMSYKDSKKTGKEIARELGVGNLLEGSFQMEGDRLRIFIRLINGKTDQQLWSDTYNKEFKDVFFIQSDIAQQIAAALKVKIDPETQSRIEYIPTENTSSYKLYLLSKEKPLGGDFGKSWKELLGKVIQQDSSFAPAYADLGFYWLVRGIYIGDLDAKPVLDSALPLLRKSIHLDSNLAAAHNYMAQVHLWYEWDFNAAEKEWKKFFELNPSGALWADNYVDFLNSSGRFEKAFDFTLKNRDIDKNQISNWTRLAFSHYYLNQPDKAMAILDSAWFRFKDPELFWHKAWLFIYLGEYQQTIDNLNKFFQSFPDHALNPRTQSWLAIAYFHTGRMNEAEKIVDSLETLSKKSAVGSPAFHLAMICAATGRTEMALQWLKTSYTNHEVEMYWLKVEPLFNALHKDPRFIGLLKKVGFN